MLSDFLPEDTDQQEVAADSILFETWKEHMRAIDMPCETEQSQCPEDEEDKSAQQEDHQILLQSAQSLLDDQHNQSMQVENLA